jgi:hypothetical protein
VIYFAQTPTGSIKIGCIEDIDTRMDQLESYYGAPLALLATMEGGRSIEAEIHGRFAHLRIGRTEQFRPDSDLMAFIGMPLLVGANPDASEAIGPVMLSIRLVGAPEWKDWVEGLAGHCRLDVSKLIDRALIDYAKKEGYKKEAPSR